MFLPIFLCLACLHHILATPHPSVYARSINLLKRFPVVRTTEEWGLWAKAQREKLQAKYGGSANALQKRGGGTVPLTDQAGDTDYYGLIAIGTPPVSYPVYLDTGSSDFWVTGDPCTVCSGDVRKFNPQASSSFRSLNTTFFVRYLTGNASGMLGQDTVQMGGFTVNAQPFGICNIVSSELQHTPVSGLLGLAFQRIAFSTVKPFWQILAERGDWSEPVMTFHLNRFTNVSDARSEEPGGVFTMGFTNKSLYVGDIDYRPIVGQPSYWLLSLTNVTVSGNNVLPPSDRESFAVIDTGTTLVAGPSNAISQLYAHIPDSRPLTGDFQGFYSVPCTSNIEISMSFGGKFWAVSRDDFVLRMQGGTSEVECVGAFFAILEDNNTLNWVVGDAFLKNVYSVFRLQPPSVGFAALSPLTLTKGSPAPSLTTGPPSGSPLPNGASRGRGTVWVSGLLVVLARYYLC